MSKIENRGFSADGLPVSGAHDSPKMGEYGAILRRRWPIAAIIAPTVLLGAAFLAFTLPTSYRASSTIMLEPSSVQKDLIDTTVASYADRQIEIVQGRVMTQETLKALVQKYDPYPQFKDMDVEQKAQKIIENTSFERVDPVTMKVLLESTAFSLYYENPDPKVAAKTATMLSELFLTYNQRSRADAAKQTASFLAQQADGVRADLTEVDQQLVQLKLKYGDAAPDSQSRNEAGLERANRDLDNLQRDIRSAEEKESMYALQLAQVSPSLVAVGGDMTDLGKVRAQLADAEQRYTPDHPDVKRLRRVMEDLIARNAAGTGKAAKANNPEYLRIDGQLQSARRELAALRASAARTSGEIAGYSANIHRSPVVEKEFSDVLRRRDALQSNYHQLQDRLRNAELAQSFESESRGERFTMVRAPFAPRLPYSPNRVGLILLGLVLSFGLTAAVIAIVESVDSTVRGDSDLPSLPGGTLLLGTIPIIMTSADRRRRNVVWGSVVCAYGVAAAAVAIAVVSAT